MADQDPGKDGSAATPAAIEADIERKRQELAHTLDALGTKLDVKRQVSERVDRVEPRQLAVAGAVVVVLVALVVWRRRR
ncbi:DUF3618 domain-containing protein [Nocardioides campestrisoli]|uniref:DUF3618 domain-containing protein n=1 Tax=Nocardioides campestrisoli TaxID=2736757 RepID=UPI0015E70B8D|nr:DUF3618 domain-containing protein [Nocardioides campestrisoli]